MVRRHAAARFPKFLQILSAWQAENRSREDSSGIDSAVWREKQQRDYVYLFLDGIMPVQFRMIW